MEDDHEADGHDVSLGRRRRAGAGWPDEDRSGGFDRGGRLVPHFDETTSQFITEAFDKADAFLLGRRTYEIFAGYWPKVSDPENPVAGGLNKLPKYVVSTTLSSADWHNSTIVDSEVPAEVRRLREAPGGELQVHGSGTLVRSLLGNDLVDELRLLVFPVIVGAGRRLFPDAGVACGLQLVDSRTTPSGVAIQVYQPTADPSLERCRRLRASELRTVRGVGGAHRPPTLGRPSRRCT